MQKLTDNIYVLVIMAMIGLSLLAGAFVLIQVAARNRIWRQQQKLLDAHIHHQQELLHAIISSQEEERKRIGMDLHDSVSSTLSALRMMIVKLTRESGSSPKTASLLSNECKQIIDRVITDVRDIAHNLSPPLGSAYFLHDVLEDLGERVNRSEKIALVLHLCETGILEQLNQMVSLALYRVLTELVNNTIRHAGAQQINILFSATSNELRIEYRDDGIGMTRTVRAGMGLHNIESRLSYIGAAYTIDYPGVAVTVHPDAKGTMKPGITEAVVVNTLHKGFRMVIRLPI